MGYRQFYKWDGFTWNMRSGRVDYFLVFFFYIKSKPCKFYLNKCATLVANKIMIYFPYIESVELTKAVKHGLEKPSEIIYKK